MNIYIELNLHAPFAALSQDDRDRIVALLKYAINRHVKIIGPTGELTAPSNVDWGELTYVVGEHAETVLALAKAIPLT